MRKSKKAAIEPFPVLVGVMGAVILLTMVSVLMGDYAELKRINPEPLGGKAVEVLDSYQETDEALLFLDLAVKLAMKDTAEKSAYNGGCPAVYRNTCGNSDSDDYALYSKGSALWSQPEGRCKPEIRQCRPLDYHVINAFKSYFPGEFTPYIIAFNSDANDANRIKLISNYQLELKAFATPQSSSGELELIGTANAQIVDKGEKFEYKVIPSFRQAIKSDLIGDFERIDSRVNKILDRSPDELLELSENELRRRIADLNKEPDESLEWKLESFTEERVTEPCYSEGCSYNVCYTVSVPCPPGTEGEQNCTEKQCEKRAGYEHHYYSTVTVQISAKNRYDQSNVYRFGLNWVSDQEKTDCGP